MKKVFSITLVILLLLGCTGCTGGISHSSGTAVRICYDRDGISFYSELSQEEANTVTAILNRKKRDLDLAVTGAGCGFGREQSFVIDGSTYCLAQDSCCVIWEDGTNNYYKISDPEMKQLQEIFTTHIARHTAAVTTAPTEAATEPTEAQAPTAAPTEPSTAPTEVTLPSEPADDDFVLVKAYIPDIFVDLRYATPNNFTNQKIYDFTDAYLRYGTVKKLILVQQELMDSGLSLKIWDSFRPPSAQFKLWDICPDPTYVSNPNKGFSSHSRGNTVDVTLVYTDGTELTLPTEFDDFSKLADRDYSDCGKVAAENAMLLENVMKKYGFKPYSGEWWHFSDTKSYPVDESFDPAEASDHTDQNT